MPKFSLRNQLIALTATLVACLVVGNVLVWNSKHTLQQAELEKQRLLDASLTFKDLRYRIVNIQQFIQDATTIGANDYSEALEQKQAAEAELNKLLGMLPEMRGELNNIAVGINGLYDTGIRMADAYFYKGRQVGNVLMKEGDDSFDSRVEQVTEKLDQAGEVLIQRMADASHLQSDMSTQMFNISTGIGVLALFMVLIANSWIGRTIFNAVGGEPDLAAEVAKKIAAGDFAFAIDLKSGDQHSILAEMKNMEKAIRALVDDAAMLAKAGMEGQLSTRADTGVHQGEFRRVVEGVNGTLDAVVGPLQMAADCVEQIAQGRLPVKIEQPFQGDFNVIKNNLNTCIDAIDALISDASLLSQAAQAGCLTTRADVARHQGDFRKIVEGVNATLDGIILPINEVVSVLSKVEQGDLSQTVNGSYQGQLQDFKNTVNSTIATLAQTILGVVFASEQIGNASRQIQATSQSLSQSSSEQAAGVEQAISGLEQMAASIDLNADHANTTDTMARQTAIETRSGGDAVKQTVEAMKDIATRISVIDDIAYQTNMLALNAAIEAARAGDLGKGFAVVAAEVRKLAERSQIAAQEIGELAESSVRTAEDAGQLLTQIVPSIAKTSALVQEIAAASQEQAVAVGHVNTAMMQMNHITQQNASASEELAATAVEMTGQADQLRILMDFFKVAGSGLTRSASHYHHATLASLVY